MVNEEKIRVMTKLASYEKDSTYKEIKEGGYYQSDYIRSHLLMTVWSYSVAYFLLLLLIGLYHFDYLLSAFRLQEVGSIIVAVVAVYILLMLACIFFSVMIYSEKFRKIRKLRREYFTEIKKLEAIYAKSKEGGNE